MGWITDLALVAFLVAQTWLGCRRGLLWQATALASLGFGLVLGLLLAPALGARLVGHLTQDPFHAQIVAFLFVAGLLGLGLRLLAAWAEAQSEQGLSKKEREERRGHDRVLGGMFGALKGCVLAAVLVAAGVTLWPDAVVWQNSRLAPPLAQAGARALPHGGVESLAAWLERSTKHLGERLQIRSAEDERSTAPATQAASGEQP